MTDLACLAATLSSRGCAIINRSLGCQTLHDHNFSRTECDGLKIAVLGFNEFMTKQFSQRADWPRLKPKAKRFAGQWIILHSVFLRQYCRDQKITHPDLSIILKELFRIPYVRLRFYYYLGSLFLLLQQKQAAVRNFALRRMRKSASPARLKDH